MIWAVTDKAALQMKLCEAQQHRQHYAESFIELRALADEQVTEHGRAAVMSHAMRAKGLELVWLREVGRLTADLQAGPVHVSAPDVEQRAAADEMAGVAV